MATSVQPLRPIWWEDGLWYLDQRCLPLALVNARALDVQAVIDAIESGAVMGARCVDHFVAFGVIVARALGHGRETTDSAITRLRSAALPFSPRLDAFERVCMAPFGTELATAHAALAQTCKIDRSIARHAGTLLPQTGAVMTYGSSGALSTGGSGTGTAAIIAAHLSGKAVPTYVSETRPLLTGMRLAAFELSHAGIVCTVFPDGAAAALMQTRGVTAIIVGAAALAANGDALGENGMYGLAVSAAHHRIPVYVAVPRAAIDGALARGDSFDVPRATPRQATAMLSASCVALEQPVDMPLSDVTPGRLIAAIVTEYGISRPPYDESLASLATRPHFSALTDAG